VPEFGCGRDDVLRNRRLVKITAVIKSLWIMGVAARGQRAFWMFLARVVTSHRHSFGEAMGLAILGHHFRMVAAQL